MGLYALGETTQNLVVAATDPEEAADAAIRTVQAGLPQSYRRCKVPKFGTTLLPSGDRYRVIVIVKNFNRRSSFNG